MGFPPYGNNASDRGEKGVDWIEMVTKSVDARG
jgi:hypothetical protein